MLRRTRPGACVPLPRRALVPILTILSSIYLMLTLAAATCVRFLVWMAIGLVVYFAYSARTSRLVTDPNYSREADQAAAARRADVTTT